MTFSANDIATFFLLIGLELVLGIDNILLISIVTGRLPESQRALARQFGLGLAFLLRILFVLGASALTRLVDPVFMGISWRGLILIAGGAFLLFKAVREIHHVVESVDLEAASGIKQSQSFGSAILQMLALDAVFSIDSVITAVGLTDHIVIIISAVLCSFLVVLYFAAAVSSFIEKHPALKILALSFLVTIGVTLFIEGLGYHVPKGYIYLPMGFALVVEFLQMRYSANRKRQSA
jgi:predicted tellurium resistance membrane protein TerC